MMQSDTLQHPVADELTAYALAREGAAVGEHLRVCPSCARYVREVEMARDTLAALEDPDVPDDVARRILSHAAPRAQTAGTWGRFGEWYRSPFVIGLSVVMASIFLLLFFLFMLH